MAHSFIDNFLGNLQAEEKKAVGRYLRNNISNAEESKTMEVFEQLSEGKPVQYKNPIALNKIKSRIFEMSLDALMMNEDYLSVTFCEFDQIYFELRKQMLQCKILNLNLTKSKTEVIDHLLNNTIRTAEKYEAFPILIEALTFKKYFHFTRAYTLHFEKVDKKIVFYESCNKAMYNATDYYYRFVLDIEGIKSRSKQELFSYLTSSIKKMKADYLTTGSQQVNYYLQLFYLIQFEYKKNYSATINQCKKIIQLMQKHPCTYREKRVGFMYDNLSYYSIFLGKKKEAESYIQKAKKHFGSDSIDMMICNEIEFNVYFYNKNFIQAESQIDHLLTYPNPFSGLFRKAKYTFYKACVYFEKKEFRKALNLLLKPLEIEKDKSEWNIVVRIFTIMLHIELNKTSDASRTLEALRKYLDRNKLDEKIKKRDHLIVKCLRELEKNDFDYTPGNKNVTAILKQLAAKNSAVSWEYFSPELIPFHEWLLKKAKK